MLKRRTLYEEASDEPRRAGSRRSWRSSRRRVAATTVVVTPANTQGWSTADTRPGGAVNYVADTRAGRQRAAADHRRDHGGEGAVHPRRQHAALQGERARLLRRSRTPPSFVDGEPSYQLLVNLDGTAATFTTFVYEPYENGVVDAGRLADLGRRRRASSGRAAGSRRGTCAVVAGAGGAPFYTLAGLKAACPNAVVVGFGVNIGTNNPSYNVETDLVDFNGTAYDFQLAPRRARTSARTAAGRTTPTRRSRTRATASATSPPAARTARTANPSRSQSLDRGGPLRRAPSFLCGPGGIG